MNKILSYIYKLVLFCIPIGIYFIVKSSYMLSSDQYKQEVHGHEVYTSIKKVKKRQRSKSSSSVTVQQINYTTQKPIQHQTSIL